MTHSPKTPTRAEALAALRGLFKLTDEPEACKLYDVINAHLNATDAPIVDWKSQKEAVFLWADEHGFTPVESEICDLLNVLIPPVSERVDGLESAIHNLKDASGDWCQLNAKDIQDLQIVLQAARLYAQGRTQSAVPEALEGLGWIKNLVRSFKENWPSKCGDYQIWLIEERLPVIESVLSAAPPVTGGAWLPIESAPTEGDAILVTDGKTRWIAIPSLNKEEMVLRHWADATVPTM